MEAVTRNLINNDWLTLIYVAAFLFLVLINQRFPEIFHNFYRLPFSKKFFIERQHQATGLNAFNLSMFVFQTVCLSLILFECLLWLKPNLKTETSTLLFFQVFLIYIVLVAGKFLVEKIVAEVFKVPQIIGDYLFYKLSYKNFLSLVLFPLSLFCYYGILENSYLALVLLGFWALVNFLVLLNYYQKNMQLVLKHSFYFILYLCALEIAPYFILYKVVTV